MSLESTLERIAIALEILLENQAVVSPATVENDDLDPTFAALAGACYSMADQLEKALNEPDQFKKAQGLRNLATQIRNLADKYAENAAAEDYRRSMESRIRRVDSDQDPIEVEKETPEKYKPKGSWAKGGGNAI